MQYRKYRSILLKDIIQALNANDKQRAAKLCKYYIRCFRGSISIPDLEKRLARYVPGMSGRLFYDIVLDDIL